jgi:hypothetical protein
VSTVDVPQEDWLPIPVPALVEPEVFAAVQEQLQENRRHARQSQRGALYLLQGLVQCQQCGYAYYGKRLSPSARKGKPRAYAYYRCLGTDAYRFGGERVCQNTQVRTDLLDVAVWQEVCTLLAHPERLAEEYRRRLQPESRGKRTSLTTVEGQMGKLRQGIARLIDSYAEGLIDKDEFEPRIIRLRQRLARVEEHRQALAEEAALQTDLQLIIGRLEDFAAKVHSGLEAADWTSQRDLIRALVKRVEVAQNEVNIVFRVDPYPGDADPEKKSLQLCRESELTAVGQRIPARGAGYVVRNGGKSPLPRQSSPVAFRGRLPHRLRAGVGCSADHGSSTETLCHVWAGDQRRKDQAGRLRSPAATDTRSQTRDLQLSGLGPLLGQDLARWVHHQTEDGGEAATPHSGRVLALVPGQSPPSSPGAVRAIGCEAAGVLPVLRHPVQQPVPGPGVLYGNARLAFLAEPPWRPDDNVASVWPDDGSVCAASAQDRERLGVAPGAPL